jgi:SAM-dependent methyltransferase
MPSPDSVRAHYGSASLITRVETALGAAGLNAPTIDWTHLAAIDQFHVGGAAATALLSGRLDLTRDTKVIDLGSGLGGPARHLAATYGCHVTGIDLNPPYVELANYLAQRAGAQAALEFHVGDVLHPDFADGAFNVVWTQHVAMNIADRSGLYAQVHRLLRPGGQFAMYDVLQGDGGPLEYPLPWAREASLSHVVSAAQQHELLDAAELHVTTWADVTPVALEWIAKQAAAAQASTGAFDLRVIMGDDFPMLLGNLARNLREGRAMLVQAVALK